MTPYNSELREIILTTIDSALYECDTITSGNVAHKIASIKQLLMYYKNIAEKDETTLVD